MVAMRTLLQTAGPGRARFQAVLLLVLVAALFFGTVVDAFRAPVAVTPVGHSTTMTLANDDHGSGHTAVVDTDCGIHPGCSLALLPDSPELAGSALMSEDQPALQIPHDSVSEPAPYHPPDCLLRLV